MATGLEGRTVLVAHPSGDLYGADLQMIHSARAVIQAGGRVVVALGSPGPLAAQLTQIGATVEVLDFPVLRRASASAGGLRTLGREVATSIGPIRRHIKRVRPDAIYVNTVTLPWWLAAARSYGVPSICHVHEAETTDTRVVSLALTSPLALADRIIVISESAREATAAMPGLDRRIRLIYNGVPGPDRVVDPPAGPQRRLIVVGRLSPRKAPDVALEATALLRAAGHDVHLDVCGTSFAGYESYEQELRERAERADLAGAVTFSGYVSPVWPAFEAAHIMLAPSVREPFGNSVVEAQLAGRPVVAAAAQGHLETVSDGRTGLLVQPSSAPAMADAVARLIADPALGERLAAEARTQAHQRFSVQRYGEEVVALVASVMKP